MTSATDFYATQMRGEEACRQNPTHATRSPPLGSMMRLDSLGEEGEAALRNGD